MAEAQRVKPSPHKPVEGKASVPDLQGQVLNTKEVYFAPEGQRTGNKRPRQERGQGRGGRDVCPGGQRTASR